MLHNQHSSVNSQLDRLERISNQISLLISNNDYERISHLDRMRKKIITDMQEKNLELSTNHKKSVLKLISQNKVIISDHYQKLQIRKNVLKLIWLHYKFKSLGFLKKFIFAISAHISYQLSHLKLALNKDEVENFSIALKKSLLL